MRKNHLIDLQVLGMTNSRKMLISENGLDLENWEEHLNASGETASMELFISRIKELNARNSVFVDNTAHDTVSKHYENILEQV